MTGKAQASDQIIVSLDGFSLAAAPIYVRSADCPILNPAMLAGNCAAGFQQSLAADVFTLRKKHGI
jgi:hypothetical protein